MTARSLFFAYRVPWCVFHLSRIARPGRGALGFVILIGLILPALAHAYADRPFEVEHGPPGLMDVSALLRDGMWLEAVERGYAVLDSTEAEYGPESLEAALVIDRLVEALWRSGDAQNPDALPLAARALAIEERALGPDHPEVAQSLQTWGNLLSKRGDFAGAEEKFEKALAIREKADGPVHVRVAGTLNDLAIVVARQGDYARSIEILDRTLAIRQEILEPDHREIAESLANLGFVHDTAGHYRMALDYTERAVVIMEAAEGPSHPFVIGMRNNIAIAYLRLADYEASRQQFESVLAASEAALGPDHQSVAEANQNLAVALQVQGNHAEARRHNEASIAILARTLGPRHPLVIQPNMFRGDYHTALGDWDRAQAAYTDALIIAEEAYGPEHPIVSSALRSIGEVHLRADRLDLAEETLTRALAVSEATQGTSHTEHAAILGALGDLASRRGETDVALDYATAAYETYEAAMGRGALTLSALENVGILQNRVGMEDEAVATLRDVVAGFEEVLGPDHPQVGEALVHLADLLLSTDPDEAFALALRAEVIGREHQRFVTRALPESEALQFARVRTSGRDIALTIAADQSDPKRIEAAWDAVVRSRAIVLDEMAARHRSLDADSDADLAALREAERRARARLANLVLLAPEEVSAANHRRLLEQARVERDDAERAVAEAGADFSTEMLGLEDIRPELPEGQALVSFVRYEDFEPTNGAATPVYLAFIREPKGGIDLVRLGDAATIEGAVRRWHQEISIGPFIADRSPEEAEATYLASARALAAMVWAPLRPHLEGAEWIYVVPDGLLHLVNFAVLPSETASYLVEDGFTLHVLTTERDLVPTTGLAVGDGLLAFGAPEFDADCSQLSADLAAVLPTEMTASAPIAGGFRGESPSCPEFRDVRFSSLPASATEVTEVADLWNTFETWGTGVAITGEAANEAAFKALVPGHRVLHVATHGFFVPQSCDPAPVSGGRGIGGMQPSGSERTPGDIVEEIPTMPRSSANPLVLSGIVLAGANTRPARVTVDHEDGILTAEEIAALDLSGVEWAVLSACETGLGEIHDAEGVLGLRRSFQVAGARTVIMSLWPVMDERAQEWMNLFYRARLESDLSTAESVREATRGVLASRRDAGVQTHPHYWAGFVATGDWR